MKNRIFLFSLVITLTGYYSLSAQVKSITLTPTTTETSSALKEALNIGVKRAVEVLSKPNGFLNDKEVKIVFPNEIKKVDQTLRSVGLGKLSDDFIKQLNTGAEKAV